MILVAAAGSAVLIWHVVGAVVGAIAGGGALTGLYFAGKADGKNKSKKLQELAKTEQELNNRRKQRENEVLEVAQGAAAETVNITSSAKLITDSLQANTSNLSEDETSLRQAIKTLQAEIFQLKTLELPSQISEHLSKIELGIDSCINSTKKIEEIQAKITESSEALDNIVKAYLETREKFSSLVKRFEKVTEAKEQDASAGIEQATKLILKMQETIKALRKEIHGLKSQTEPSGNSQEEINTQSMRLA